MRGWRVSRAVLAIAAVPAAICLMAFTPHSVALLGHVLPGEWQFRSRDPSEPVRTMCILDPDTLIQLRHQGMICSRYVIDNAPMLAVVHYRCPGAGHGRTSIRMETSGLLQIDSQGIAEHAPFDMTMEARRLGPCRSRK